jgi:hypothetical protein
VRSAIGEIPLCLGGEVDCVNSLSSSTLIIVRDGAEESEVEPGSPHLGLEGCMELKTNKVIENEKQEMIFHKYVALLTHLFTSFKFHRTFLSNVVGDLADGVQETTETLGSILVIRHTGKPASFSLVNGETEVRVDVDYRSGF